MLVSDACSTFVEASHQWSIQFLGGSCPTTAHADATIEKFCATEPS
jgi:isochorismate hydrolase